MKSGVLTPILKKGKDKTIPGNYRGIVVTNTFSKILESILKDRLEDQLQTTQNPPQRGFTEKSSSKFTAFIMCETISIYRNYGKDLEVLALDAEKAFDTVNHDILLNKLYHDGIMGDMWTLISNMYRNMNFKVKWEGNVTEDININQGIRQGAKLSTLLYKRYNNTILNSITASNLGAKIGDINVASPACADDIVLLGSSTEMQAMIDLVHYNTTRDLVKLNPSKTEVIHMARSKQRKETDYYLEGQEVKKVKTLKHLGITHQENNKVNIDDRVKLGRKTIYALLGSGLHARSGLSPVVQLKIWNTYVVPRFMYGIEVQKPTKADLNKLEIMQRSMFKHFQCLPDRTASIAVYTLIGAEPIEATYDKLCINLLVGIARLDTSVEKQILLWEMENKEQDNLFINTVTQVLKKYQLPNPWEILQNPPKKSIWKTTVKRAINKHWYEKFSQEKMSKSSLRHFEIQQEPIGTPHNIWKVTKDRKHEIQMAEVKARLVTDTYMLQYHSDKFRPNGNAGQCKMCQENIEDMKHFILECKALHSSREPNLKSFIEAVEGIKGGGAELLLSNKMLLQTILDCSATAVKTLLNLDHKALVVLERLSQKLCFELHRKRTNIMLNLLEPQ